MSNPVGGLFPRCHGKARASGSQGSIEPVFLGVFGFSFGFALLLPLQTRDQLFGSGPTLLM